MFMSPLFVMIVFCLTISPDASLAQTEEVVWIHNPSSGVDLYCHIHRPIDFDPDLTYPGLVLVPGGSGSGIGFDQTGRAQQYADLGLIVIHFDPDGRGLSTNDGTYTVEDYCGYIQQDGLHEILLYLSNLPEVQSDNIGVSTNSYGITMGAGTLGRYPDSPPVKFLIDTEGPSDRSDTAVPNGHVPHDIADEEWWYEREPVNLINGFPGYYQRLQSVTDHAQPDNEHAIVLNNRATHGSYGGEGICTWTRVNSETGFTANSPNTVYSMQDPPEWLPNEVDFTILKEEYLLELTAMPPLVTENPNEPPIQVIFDVHIEPMHVGPDYETRRTEVNWLWETALQYGARLTLESNGEYMEYCLEYGHEADFQQYLESGFDVGTHSHLVTYEGPHNWVQHSGPMSFGLVNQIIGDAEMFVDAVVGAENNFHLCTQTGDLYLDDMMDLHQFDFITGPGEEGYWSFGHQVWNPFRPATAPGSGVLEEDLTMQFCTIPHLPQINKPNAHGMNLLLDQMKRRFLMIYIEWLSRVRNNMDDKIWVWGFNSHPGQTNQHRDAIVEMLSWLNDNFIDHTLPTGDVVAVYASGSEIHQSFLDWEAVNPGASSFNHVDGDPYPYTFAAMPTLLNEAGYDAEIDMGENINVHRMLKNEQPIYAVWTDSGSEVVDFSTQLSGDLLTTDGHGNQTVQHSTVLVISEEPLFIEAETGLAAPENLTIQINIGLAELSWDPVESASHYRVYASINPYAGFVNVSGEVTTTSWSEAVSGEQQFYQVKAVVVE